MENLIIRNKPKGWRRLYQGEVIKDGDWCIRARLLSNLNKFMWDDWKNGWSAKSIGFKVNKKSGYNVHYFRKYETQTHSKE